MVEERAVSGRKIQNPGSFGSRDREDEEMLFWVRTDGG